MDADFRGAELCDADFSDADLWDTDFSDADFSDADFWDTDFWDTDFWDTDFRGPAFRGADGVAAGVGLVPASAGAAAGRTPGSGDRSRATFPPDPGASLPSGPPSSSRLSIWSAGTGLE